jgi:hypothetical protein
VARFIEGSSVIVGTWKGRFGEEYDLTVKSTVTDEGKFVDVTLSREQKGRKFAYSWHQYEL